MRRVRRAPLLPDTQAALDCKQAQIDEIRRQPTADIEAFWKSARQTKCIHSVLTTLKSMAGDTERCMYCSDSHGTDIDHFWPKKHFPERMFRWPNLLLACAECNRFKDDELPTKDGIPMFVDPTLDDPWEFLDYHPPTGNLVPRYASPCMLKGELTVTILHLDSREALANAYKRTYRRIIGVVNNFMGEVSPSSESVIHQLGEADDRGLLGWCFSECGSKWNPFSELALHKPDIWLCCVNSFCAGGARLSS
jgi:uncharacterized protein (TIGR02646 family)